MSNTSGILSSSPTPFQSVVTVGNGARCPHCYIILTSVT
jgi:hypothetical protein